MCVLVSVVIDVCACVFLCQSVYVFVSVFVCLRMCVCVKPVSYFTVLKSEMNMTISLRIVFNTCNLPRGSACMYVLKYVSMDVGGLGRSARSLC